MIKFFNVVVIRNAFTYATVQKKKKKILTYLPIDIALWQNGHLTKPVGLWYWKCLL